jgi:NADH-quinone oxidoreductase subunit L
MVLTAVLTAAYSLRAWLMVFFGPAPAAPDLEAAAPHEPGSSMLVPLYLLSIPTVLGGLVVAYPQAVFGPGEYSLVHTGLSVVMTLLVVATGVLVAWLWQRAGGRDPWHAVVVPHPPVDRLYATGVVRPVQWLSRVVRLNDRDVIEGYTDFTGAVTRGLGWLLRRAQTGSVQTYLMVLVVGACAAAVAAGVAG